jgi:hypothetical protein
MIFSPFAGIRPHAILENQFSELLITLGHEVTQITCDSIFDSYCPVFQNHGISTNDSGENKRKICNLCKSSAQYRISKSIDVRQYIDENDTKNADMYIKEISAICKNANGSFDLEQVLGRKFVRSSVYESLLKFKKRNLLMDRVEVEQIFATIRSSYLADIASSKFLKAINPEIVFIFTPQYGINAAVAENAIRNNSIVYYMAGNNSLAEMHKTLKIYNWNKFHLKDPALDYWSLNQAELTRSDIRRSQQHFKAIAKNKSVFTYSPKTKNRSIREFFDIRPQNKIILLALSSYDEFFAAETCGYFPDSVTSSPVFADQNAWVEETVNWASKQEFLTLIIRPHPREFPNRRDNRSAPINSKLNQILGDLPKNVLVDLPDYQLSMQEYYDEVDAIAVSWSSVALEALVRDIPVISYDENLVMIPSDIHLSGITKEMYLSHLENIIDGKAPSKFSLNAYKWFAFSNFKGSVFLGGGFLMSGLVRFIPKLSAVYFVLERRCPKWAYFIDSLFKGSRKDKLMLRGLLEGKHNSFYDLEKNKSSST